MIGWIYVSSLINEWLRPPPADAADQQEEPVHSGSAPDGTAPVQSIAEPPSLTDLEIGELLAVGDEAASVALLPAADGAPLCKDADVLGMHLDAPAASPATRHVSVALCDRSAADLLRGDGLDALRRVAALFEPSADALLRLKAHMATEIDMGLRGDTGGTLRMLPVYCPNKARRADACYLSMELFGANLRISLVERLRVTQSRLLKIPTVRMHGDVDKLLNALADCLQQFCDDYGCGERRMSVGLALAYPIVNKTLASATVVRWLDGRPCPIVGRDIGREFQAALERRGSPATLAACVNDTAATLLAAGAQCDVAVIVANGTNAAYCERSECVRALHGADYGYDTCIVNTEWGGFGSGADAAAYDYLRNEFDRAADAQSAEGAGPCFFDKLVGGRCVGELCRMALRSLAAAKAMFTSGDDDAGVLLADAGVIPAKCLVDILEDDSADLSECRRLLDELGFSEYTAADLLALRHVVAAICNRSASYTAAALAACLQRVVAPPQPPAETGHGATNGHLLPASSPRRLTVTTHGWMCERNPQYAPRLLDALAALLPASVEVAVVQQAGGTLAVGAAVAAAHAS